jgi:hypothetical protein
MASERGWFRGGKGTGIKRPQIRVLTAAATRIDLSSRPEARRQRAFRQGWQLDAWAYRDSVPELRYGINFLANCASRMRLFPAAYAEDGETDAPVPLIDAGAPIEVIDACNQAMSDLGNGRLAMASQLHSLSTNLSVSGEAFLLGQEDPDTGRQTWSIRSIDEVGVYDDEWKLREVPMDPQGIFGWQTLDPELTVVSRMWQPHPRYRAMADSATKAIMDELEALLILRRDIRATGRSRLAGAGMLLIPNEIDIEVLNDDNDDPTADPFMAMLTKAMVEPIADEGSASAVVPIVVRGPGDVLAQVRLVQFATSFDALAASTRGEIVGVIATGLDMPKEVIEGMADINHWGQWQIDDNTFRQHTEPHVITLVDCYTSAYLRPYLNNCEIDPDVLGDWAERILMWYDPTELVTHPDQTTDAFQLHDRLAISDKALLRVAGFSATDAPEVDEIQLRMLRTMRTWPPNLVMEFLHLLNPSLAVPPITVAGTIPGVKPGLGGGADVGPPPPAALPPGSPGPDTAAPADAGMPAAPPQPAPAPADASTAPKGPPPSSVTAAGALHFDEATETLYQFDATAGTLGAWTVIGQGRAVMDALTAAVATIAPKREHTAQSLRLSRRLAAIDASFRSRIAQAANAAMLRQLEKAGGRLNSKVARTEALRTKIAHSRKELIGHTLGEDVVTAAGMSAADLMSSDWATLKSQWFEWGEAAQRQAIETAAQLAGIATSDESAALAARTMSKGLDAGWQLLSQSMTSLAQHALYNPDLNVDAGTVLTALNPDTMVPTGVIRAAVGVAGGAKPQDFGIVKVASGAEVPAIPLGVPVGQIGTGATVSTLLSDSGASQESYEWSHGASGKPLPCHAFLDGVEFASFDDDKLAPANNPEWDGFPDVEYLMAGDHSGCFPADTVASGPRPVGATLRDWKGELVEIGFASGEFLSATPNHPILTSDGWVAAGELHEGHEVVRCIDTEGIAGLVPNGYQMPARIEEIADTFGVSSGMDACRVEVTPEDFHGDGGGSEVAVVRTDRDLRDRVEAALREPSGKPTFASTDPVARVALAGESATTERLEAVGDASLGVVGRSGPSEPLLGREAGRMDESGIVATAAQDACLQKSLSDRAPIDAERLGDGILGLAAYVSGDKVLHVKRYPFAGHVYNLDTVVGWYIANGVIVHNCSCDFVALWVGADSGSDTADQAA